MSLHEPHEHDHNEHDHHGHHHPAPRDFGNAFQIAIGLNIGFVLLEFFFGYLAESTALLADAGHNLSDVLALFLAWGAALLAKKTPTSRYSYGFGGSTILAALLNAIVLLLVCGAIAWESILRLMAPAPVAGMMVAVVALIGVFINGFSAWLFMRGSRDDLNVRGAYLHMAADALISLSVVVAGGIILMTGWNWLDPLMSLLIVGVVVYGTWGLLRESLQLALAGVPQAIDLGAVKQWFLTQPGVEDVHDLHIWGLSTSEVALTAHLVVPEGHPGDEQIEWWRQTLQERFQIAHSTLQIEQAPLHPRACSLLPG